MSDDIQYHLRELDVARNPNDPRRGFASLKPDHPDAYNNLGNIYSRRHDLDRDPERLEQVAQLILDLRQTDDGKALLPDDLDAIWEPIWAVRSRQIERAKKNLETGK